MKQFMYFETTDGGMNSFSVYSEADLANLYGWKSPDCIKEDHLLVDWMAWAEVGEMKEHRLGCLVRMRDNKNKQNKQNEPKHVLLVGDVVSVHVHGGQYTISHRAKVLRIPCATGDSWVFEDLDTFAIHHVSEGCTVSKRGL